MSLHVNLHCAPVPFIMVVRTFQKGNSRSFPGFPGHIFRKFQEIFSRGKRFRFTLMYVENRYRRDSAENFLILNKYFLRFPKIISKIYGFGWKILFREEIKKNSRSFPGFPGFPGHIFNSRSFPGFPGFPESWQPWLWIDYFTILLF